MIDRNAIGRELPRVSLLITRSRLRNFAQSTGDTSPVYTDVDAARQSGHRDLPVPPTFMFGIEHELGDPYQYLVELGADLRDVLHGGQEFTYHQMAYAGDELTARGRISDIYEKKGGLLWFIVKDSLITNQSDEVVADLRSTLVVQNRNLEGIS